MAFVRLAETVQSLYAELLDQLRAADAEDAVSGPTGTFVSKQIRTRTYWYLQKSNGATKRQIYLGPESPEVLEKMRTAGDVRQDRVSDETRRRELVAMLAAGGMFREAASVATVLRVLGEASVFRAGGVLVGTQAFSCIANMLGVSFERESLRTADIDVAHDTNIPVGFEERRGEDDLLQRLRASNAAFFAVPGIDSREPSTSFKVRGRDLRIDFLTPNRSRGTRTKPIVLQHLGVAAQPLHGLDYLIEDAVDAALVGGIGIRVNIPSPARYAFHKLWVAGERSVSEAAKSRKDIRQATQLLEVLAEDRPHDVTAAFDAIGERRAMRRAIIARMKSFGLELEERLTLLVQNAGARRR
jgi:hypothetical protein